MASLYYFKPGEVTVLLARRRGAEPPPPSPGARIAEANQAVLQLFANQRVALMAGREFDRTDRRPPRDPVLFEDPARRAMLHTVNLESWIDNPQAEDAHGRLLQPLQAVRDVCEMLNAKKKESRLTAGPYQLVAASPNWLTLPSQDF